MTRKAEVVDDRTTITVVDEIDVPPERVIQATLDFSENRRKVFKAISKGWLHVHSLTDSAADVTEGGRLGPFVMWERCRYEWSPDSVIATVIDSNVYAFPGSSWEIRVAPTAKGSRVEMIWTRVFLPRPRGRIMSLVYKYAGPRAFTKYGRQILESLAT